MATYSGTPSTVVTNQALTAALWTAEVTDPLTALTGAWNAFTPTLSQGASTDISATKACEYIRVGKLFIARYRIDATAAGTAGSNVTLTLPVTASGSGQMLGSAMYIDADSTDYTGLSFAETATTLVIYTPTGKLGTSPAVTVASGDIIFAQIMGEAA